MRNLETWTAAVALALTTIATLLLSPAIGLIALVISAVSFGLAHVNGLTDQTDLFATLLGRN